MRPILFVWRGISVHSFHVMTYLALLTVVFLTVHFAQGAGLNPDRTAAAVLLLFIPGFIVSRLFYVARHWDHFRDAPMRILRRSEGGLSLYGGLIGMFAGSIPLLRMFDLPFALFWDSALLGAMGGLVVAKGACLLNGCCYGQPTDHWCGVHLPDHRGVWLQRFPSQPMEMAWAAVVLLLLLTWRSVSPPPAGILACAVVALHPLGRLFLQTLRDEGPAEDAAVRKTCLVLIAAALLAGLLIWFWR